MIIVSDATPLISLMKADQLDVLRKLYGEVLIPQAVFAELTSNSRYAYEAQEIQNSGFIRVVSVNDSMAVESLQEQEAIDRGESEAIQYAIENKADILLMDESAGRKVAQSKGLHIQGTIGVLMEAYDESVLTVNDIEVAIAKLKNTKRHISDKLYEYVLNYVGKK